MTQEIINIEPQPGPQTQLLTSNAEIIFYGGAAGGGKTYGLLIDPLRYYREKYFRGVIFRRTTKQIRTSGGLWDQSRKIYGLINGISREGPLDWTMPSGFVMQFAHLQFDAKVYDWQGTELSYLGFDEVTHFSEFQFFYMLSRLRSTTGIPGCVRATCNPDALSWVKKFIQWYIDEETGYAYPERSGVIRYFIRKDDEVIWGDTAEELKEKFPSIKPKSFTFISASVFDNKILLDKDPDYLSNLDALPLVDRERLRNANWNIIPSAGTLFKKRWFEVVNALPKKIMNRVRCWDKAATEKTESNDPDYTVGVLLAVDNNGICYVEDVIREQLSAGQVEKLVLNTARQDGTDVTILNFQDPGSAGKFEVKAYTKLLSGFALEFNKITINKVTAAKPASAQSEAGNIKIFKATWNKNFLDELEAFPDGKHDDQVDAFSGAFNYLNADNVGSWGDSNNEEDDYDEDEEGSLAW